MRASGTLSRIKGSEVCEVGTALLQGTVAELEAVRNDADASVLQRWLASLISEGVTKADASSFRAILDRLVGKPKEEKDIAFDTPASASSTARIEAMTYEEKVAELDRLRRVRIELGKD